MAAVVAEVDRIKRANGNAFFKTQSRAEWAEQRSKPRAPPLGHYTPRWSLLDPDYSKAVPYRKESPINAGWLRKASLGIKHMKLCPNAVRTMEGWVQEKLRAAQEGQSLEKANKRSVQLTTEASRTNGDRHANSVMASSRRDGSPRAHPDTARGSEHPTERQSLRPQTQ